LSTSYYIVQTEQLVLLSAFLGGFSATFLAAILALKSSERVTNWIVCLSAISACSFIVAAIISIAIVNGLQPDSPAQFKSEALFQKNRPASALALLIGIFSLLGSIGLSGWIRSKQVGLTTSTVAVISIVLVLVYF